MKDYKLSGMKIQGKLTLGLGLFGLLLVAVMAIPFYRATVHILERQQFQLLEAVLFSRIESIEHAIELRREQVRYLSRTWMPGRIAPGQSLDGDLRERLTEHLNGILHLEEPASPSGTAGLGRSEWDRLAVVDLDGEPLVVSGQNPEEAFLSVADREMLEQNGEFVQLVWRGSNQTIPRLRFAREVIHVESGKRSAYLEAEISMDALYPIALDRSGLGETGEVLVFGENGGEYRLMTPLRHDLLSERSMTQDGEAGESVQFLSLSRDDLQRGVRKGGGARSVKDYRGVEVRCEWAAIPELGWIVAAKMDRSELYGPVAGLNRVVGWSLGGVLLFGLLFAWRMARTLSDPIEKLTTLFGRISRGEEVRPVRVDRQDELGVLAQRANDSIGYLNRIRHHAERITKGDTTGTLGPLDPRDKLGRALEAMTFSIRRYRSRIARLLRESRRQNRRLTEQRKEIHQELAIRRSLQQRLLEAHDRERQQVGRELHDGLGQMLTGIRMMSEQLASEMRAEGDEHAGKVAEISGMVREADEFVRVLSRGMALQDVSLAGLDNLLRNLSENMEKLFGVQPELTLRGDLEFEDAVATAIYRIVQEAVSNALRHADPDWIKIDVRQEDRDVQFTIRNNGKPFKSVDPEVGGVGLQTMAYRASTLGGDLKVESEEDGVTRVHGRIPFENQKVRP